MMFRSTCTKIVITMVNNFRYMYMYINVLLKFVKRKRLDD